MTENYEKTKEPERHLTFTKETSYESKYLPNIGATGAVHAEQVVDVLMNSTVRTLSLLTTLMSTQVGKVEWLQF